MTRPALRAGFFPTLLCALIPVVAAAQAPPSGEPAQQSSFQVAQNVKTQVFLKPSTSVYLELLGKGFYSLNVDLRQNKSSAMSVGMQVAEDAYMPSFMMYRFQGESYRRETGLGVSAVLTKTDGLAGMMIHGAVGRRYQTKNGLLFRMTFAPFIGIPFTSTGRFVILPWVGVRVGYSR